MLQGSAPSTRLRLVPLPRFAWEDKTAGAFLPRRIGEGDRPKGGGGGLRRTQNRFRPPREREAAHQFGDDQGVAVPGRPAVGGAGRPRSPSRRAKTNCVARCSPFAARLTSCVTAASSLVIRRRRPFSFASTFSASALATSPLKARSRFGRPRGLPDWPVRKRVSRRGRRWPALSSPSSPTGDGSMGDPFIRPRLRRLRLSHGVWRVLPPPIARRETGVLPDALWRGRVGGGGSR